MTKPIRGGANLLEMSQLISTDLIKVQDQYTDPSELETLSKSQREAIKAEFQEWKWGWQNIPLCLWKLENK